MDNQDQRIVMILGAGATIADCMGRTPAKRPPLDRGFFSDALKTHGPQLYHVREYMKNNYGVDINSPREDSLERIMAAIYTDSIGGPLEREAFDAFRTLVKAFLSRLASTTNTVEMTRRCRLYRLIVQQLNAAAARTT